AALWIGVPALAVGVMSTVVGIPLGLGVLVFVLPVLGFLGYLATGLRVGAAVLRSTGAKPEPARPYASALLGVAILLLLGTVPGVGALATLLAATVGAGALVLGVWRRERAEGGLRTRRISLPVRVARGGEAPVGVAGEDR
ncbi:MAG TPA: hypothetical protein VF263_12310, partial [Longimicrobiaceae bacterium]